MAFDTEAWLLIAGPYTFRCPSAYYISLPCLWELQFCPDLARDILFIIQDEMPDIAGSLHG